ncbi:MAG: hypothetical protein WBE48_23455 [Xanthobacteraceae bacterium]|jgi:hypothetical protein
MFGRIAAVFESAVSLALVAPAVITPTFAAPTATKLAPNDIQSTFFTGQPFTAATNSNVKFMMTFTPDGKMTRAPAGGGGRGEGTWKLSKAGFCTTWKNAGANCFTVTSAGNNKWSVLKGSTIMATWSK